MKLNKEILESINPEKIIYAEQAPIGAMGNAGGIIIYLYEGVELNRYELNVREDEAGYLSAQRILGATEEKGILQYYYGGMGNNVFKNAQVDFQIDNNTFICSLNGNKFTIRSSVYGVFESVKDLIVSDDIKY